MPRTSRQKPIYQRGNYRLYPREGRNHEIIWYDAERKRERSTSAGTTDDGQAKLALDRMYLADNSQRVCPTCHRPWDHSGSPLLATAIADYLIGMEGKAGERSARGRLGHITDYLIATDATVRCASVDEGWIARFRSWMEVKEYQRGKTKARYSLSQIEGCVMQLAAAINATPGEKAAFRAEQQKSVSKSPTYRADIKTLAAMFNFCLRPEARSEKEQAMLVSMRASLLAYLRMAVATWARPDAIYDIKSDQWHSAARVLDLNPAGRRQTKKYRPRIPVAKQMAPWLDGFKGNWLNVTTVRGSWDRMKAAIGLPGGREAGEKLIRRSIATLARKRIGEANWRQGEMMLGHAKASISDIYAIPDPANLGLALAATESIIDEIEALAPGAYRAVTANNAGLKVINGGKNG